MECVVLLYNNKGIEKQFKQRKHLFFDSSIVLSVGFWGIVDLVLSCSLLLISEFNVLLILSSIFSSFALVWSVSVVCS